ncbi:557c945d-38a4-45d2-90bc-9adff41c47b7 [Thermothielavioides terrestris]|jgi:hypothetical protein
MSLL